MLFVRAGDEVDRPSSIMHLSAMIEEGGSPLAYFTCEAHQGKLGVRIYALRGAKDGWPSPTVFEQYLRRVAQEIMTVLERQGVLPTLN
jgi:hypothetical protein